MIFPRWRPELPENPPSRDIAAVFTRFCERRHASSGWGLVVRTTGRWPRLRSLDDQTSATPRRRLSDWVRSESPYPSSVKGLAPQNWLRSARRMRFAWRAEWLGKSSLTGRAPLSCNHERWSACRHAAGSFVRHGGASVPAEHLASGNDLTFNRIAKKPGGTSPQVHHQAGDVRCPRIRRIRRGRTGLGP